MKTIIFLLTTLVIYSCNNSSTNEKGNKLKDTLSVASYENNSLKRQILYHGDCSFSLSETDGWEANPNPPQLLDDIRILVLYEPKIQIKHSAPIGIYANVIFKEDYKDPTLNGFLKGEKEMAINQGENVIEAKPIKTQDNKTAIIRKYLNNNIGEYYSLAYIDELNYIIIVNYTAKDSNDYNNYHKSFEDIVRSYRYLGITVMDGTKK